MGGGVGAGVGGGVGAGVGGGVGADSDGLGDGRAVAEGLAVGRGVGRGVARGAQLLTPEPATRRLDSGTRYLSGGITPVVVYSDDASARMPLTSGSWIDPRPS